MGLNLLKRTQDEQQELNKPQIILNCLFYIRNKLFTAGCCFKTIASIFDTFPCDLIQTMPHQFNPLLVQE